MSTHRLTVLCAFFMNGALMATWVSRIPNIQERLSLSEGDLGILLFGISAGVLAALSIAGGLIARFGSRKVTVVGAFVMCLTIPLFAITPHPILLWFVMFVFGGAMSAMDVAMNAQAVIAEKVEKKPYMSSFHAAFSIGGLVGALLGAGMASWSIGTFMHFSSAAILSMVAIFTFRYLQNDIGIQDTGNVFSLPPRALWPLGALAFCTALGEGAMADWSAVYLKQVINTSASTAALGFAAFSLTMTIGRLCGDWLKTVLDPVLIVRIGGAVAALGLLAATLSSEVIVVLVGFGGVGLGLANIIPLAFSAAGNHAGVAPGVGIASVASIGYAGLLAGPPVIGLVAEELTLRTAFLIVTVLVGLIVLMSKAVKESAVASSAN